MPKSFISQDMTLIRYFGDVCVALRSVDPSLPIITVTVFAKSIYFL